MNEYFIDGIPVTKAEQDAYAGMSGLAKKTFELKLRDRVGVKLEPVGDRLLADNYKTMFSGVLCTEKEFLELEAAFGSSGLTTESEVRKAIAVLRNGNTLSVKTPEPTVADSVAATLAQRGSRYGDFTDHAEVCQRIKWAMANNQAMWNKLPDVHKQALEVIADKIARILTGDHNYDDNWHDIQGYAKLVEDRLPKG